MTGYNQPKSLVGFKASMSDWAALDVTAAVAWMRERYHTLPLCLCRPFLRRPGAGTAAPTIPRCRARCSIAAQAATLETDGLAGALPRLCDHELRRRAPDPRARLHAGLGRPRQDLPKGVFEQWASWVMQPALSVRRRKARRAEEFPKLQGRVARAVHHRRSLGDAAGGRTAVRGLYVDQAGHPDDHARGYRRQQDRPFRIFQARASRHAVARCGGMDFGGVAGIAPFSHVVPAKAGPIPRGSLDKADTRSHSRGAKRPGDARNVPSPMEGVGNAGRPMRPQPVCIGSVHTVVTASSPESPGIPARGWF